MIVCLGAAALDRKYHALGDLELGTSNPARGRCTFGGVARNVAENLARLGASVSLGSIVGEDETGASIVTHLRRAGVNADRVIVRSGTPTAEYVAILDRTDGLAIAAADMEIFDSLTLEDVAWVRALAPPPGWIFADCNLPADVLAFLIASPEARGKLALDAVSAPKVIRLPRDLHGVDVLFVNEDEARAYLAVPPGIDAIEMARKLVRRGATAVVLTQGARGLIVADATEVTTHPAPLVATRDVTGAGDALVAGTLLRLSEGVPLRGAIRTGLLLAGITLESEASVHPDLTAALLQSASARLEESVR